MSVSSDDARTADTDGGRLASFLPQVCSPVVDAYRGGLKRVLDVTVVLAALFPVLFVILVLAAVVALDGGRPFYRQPRVGRGGRIYMLWKLRTMCPDADAALLSHLQTDAEAQAEWTSTQKLRNDPRITRWGRTLRKTSLDELPQLWNVLKGDIGLVGPRPMMPSQQALYPGQSYYDLRPGITGLWQVSERNSSTFADRALFDTRYDEALSFRTDARLLAATVKVVLRGTGC